MSNLVARNRPAEILLSEDNDNDAELLRICFKRTKFAVNLHHVHNGEECLAFLRKEGAYADVPTPDLILLDLNMPRMDGREVLAAITRDNRLQHLPIVILTTSDAQRDVFLSYKLRCNSYIVKPVGFEQFAAVVQSIAHYWFALVELPQAPYP
jgi:two-component system, chemotaxis family, response regulator Rcp1